MMPHCTYIHFTTLFPILSLHHYLILIFYINPKWQIIIAVNIFSGHVPRYKFSKNLNLIFKVESFITITIYKFSKKFANLAIST